MALRECFHLVAPRALPKPTAGAYIFFLAPLLTILYVRIAIMTLRFPIGIHKGPANTARNGRYVLNISFFARKVYLFRTATLAAILNSRGLT
jgi:hypothetical protein